jgi:hypothetical protein
VKKHLPKRNNNVMNSLNSNKEPDLSVPVINGLCVHTESPRDATRLSMLEVLANLIQEHATHTSATSAPIDQSDSQDSDVARRQLKTALNRANSAIETRQVIEGQIDDAIRLQPAVANKLENAMELVESVEHCAELHGDDLPTPSPAHEMLANARQSSDTLAAFIQGLVQDLISQEEEIIAASSALSTHVSDFAVRSIAEYSAKFVAAADEFLEVARTGIGMSQGLGYPLPGLDDIALVNPSTGQAIPVLIRSLCGNHGWHNEPNDTVTAGRESITVVKGVLDVIEEIEGQIEHERRERDN